MRVAFYTPYALFRPHFETDLELMQQHLDRGDSVTALTCDGQLDACDINPSHCPGRCVKCRLTRQVGFARLSQPINVQTLGDLSSAQIEERIRVCESAAEVNQVADLKQWTIGDFDIGYAVLSSLVSMHRDPAPCLETHRDLVIRLAAAAWTAYQSSLNFLRQNQVDLVCLFNGRHVAHRGMIRACQALGIPFAAHERGHDPQHFEVYENALPHDISYVQRCVVDRWDAADPSRREEAGHTWFRERVQGVDRRFKSYVNDQDPQRLPDDWNPERHNVSIFISSEDEFVAIGDQWSGPIYSSQLEGLRQITASLTAAEAAVRLYLRVHPNLIGLDNGQTRGLRQLRSPHLVTIPADSAVSTYALMQCCDATLSFGSTAGIEATYWGKPSILAGMSFYRDLGGTHNPSNHAELMEQLLAQLRPCSQQAALRYGHYMATYGEPYRYFNAEGLFGGTFKGKAIRLSWRQRMEARLARWFKRRAA